VQGVKLYNITREDVYRILDDKSIMCLPTNTVLQIVDNNDNEPYTPLCVLTP